ncbi:MAG: penicillin-binding transpeptidase domain-containing protein [Candidatus Omnitrophota bacterium]
MHIRKHSLRFSLIFLTFFVLLLVFTVKLLFIQIFSSSFLANIAKKQHDHLIELEPKRGGIYDRHRRPLALNVTAYSLYAKPRMMTLQDKEKAIDELSRLLHLKESYLNDRLDRNKYFIWLARKLSPDDMQKIKDLQLHGLDFLKESKRFYPNQSLGMHVLGFVGMDHHGLEALELLFDRQLKGESGWSQIIRDAKHRELLIEKKFIPAKDGFDLVLTIDETIQYIAERALEKAFKKHNAKGASIILMNPKTGEILAMANQPSFDGNKAYESPSDAHRNRALVDMYEPGSVFKIVTAAAALEEKIFNEKDKIFCENGEYRVANHILHDYHPYGTLTFSEVFEQSSNIGVTKIAQKLGPAIVYKYASLFRFGQLTGINLPGEIGGILKKPSQWSKTTIGAFPIGQEVTVTALQLVCAIATIANDGIYMKPFVVKYIQDQKGEIIDEYQPKAQAQVISQETAVRLKNILTKVVEQGTGRMARIKNVSVAGKTGTAQKVVDGRYSQNKFYASFIGFAPVDDPQIAAVVVFDEPHPNHFGGTVAAPVFKEVLEDALKYMKTAD